MMKIFQEYSWLAVVIVGVSHRSQKSSVESGRVIGRLGMLVVVIIQCSFEFENVLIMNNIPCPYLSECVCVVDQN